MLTRALKFLNDPQTVADFQRLCGVRVVSPGDGRARCSTGRAGPGVLPVSQEQNGLATCVQSGNKKPLANNNNLRDSNPQSEYNDLDPGDFSQLNDAGNANANGNDNVRSRKQQLQGQTRHIVEGNKNEEDSSGGSETDDAGEEEFIVTNKLLHYVLLFGASLGNEIFYITFFPYWFWNIDGYVGRRACIFWCMFMYLGQATKDIVKWPRPASPPVVRMEKRYSLEYGMPSTHAMVGAGLPFSLLFLTLQRYEYPDILGWMIALTWCAIVCVSRVYLGMHTVLDVLAGLAYVFLLMPIIFPFLDTIDNFILTSPYAPIACLLVPLTLCVCYPTLDKWSTARGDTTVILSVTSGIAIGHWYSYQYGLMQHSVTPPPYQIIYPTWTWFGQMLMRLVIGVTVLFATRAILKTLTYSIICSVTGIKRKDIKAGQNIYVELPYKFITYTAVAFNTVYVAPQVFRILGIERETFFTEL